MTIGIQSLAAEAQKVAQQNADKWFRVVLKRSLIGLHWKTRRTAEALGLRRVGQKIYKPITPHILGSIFKLKELVQVDIKRGLPNAGNGKHPCGFQVIGSILNKH